MMSPHSTAGSVLEREAAPLEGGHNGAVCAGRAVTGEPRRQRVVITIFTGGALHLQEPRVYERGQVADGIAGQVTHLANKDSRGFVSATSGESLHV